MKIFLIVALLLTCIILMSFYWPFKKVPNVKTPPVSEVMHPEWSRNAVIYEVNIRQYSPEGTFAAFEKDLPRVKKLGVDVIWLMPVYPIGVKNRKEPLGSYYSIRDFRGINPEFGNMNDFKHLINKIHELGLKVILDCVPNHSSWDNPLIKEHPEYYKKDSLGKMVSPFDWTDVVQFDYNNRELRKYMLETLKWWVRETNIDGFRCDVAFLLPGDFLNDARTELDGVKKVFLVAESEQPALHEKAFDVTYDWKLYHLMNDIAKGTKSATNIEKHFAWVDSVYPADAYLMQFTSNHDENSWSGTEYERLGNGAKTFAVLAATVPGIMLIYNGQEAGFDRRLKFFEKDLIDWKSNDMFEFYQKLISMRKTNQALFNGDRGGVMKRVPTNMDSTVYAFCREAKGDKIFVVLNLSSQPQDIQLKSKTLGGSFRELFTGNHEALNNKTAFQLKPWEYRVYVAETGTALK